MTTVSSVSVDQPDFEMRQLASVFAELNHLVVRYCDEVAQPPYWFTERASLSLLAAAAWRQGWVAIEEYSTRKVLVDRQDPNVPVDRHGRCDLFLRSPQGTTFALEAKQVVCKPTDFEVATADVLRRARHDARQLFATEATCRVGLAFVIPTLPATPTGEHGMEFSAWLDKCRAIVEGSRRLNHAYVFPGLARRFLGPARRGFWPGDDAHRTARSSSCLRNLESGLRG